MPRFGFFSLLHTSVLEHIDEAVSMEVTPHIKTMGALPQSIQAAATEAAEYESGAQYLDNLALAWQRHNDLALELDDFLVELYSGKRSLHERDTLHRARTFLPRAYKTEDQKRIYSVGVKLALDINIRRASRRYSLTDDQKTLLLSCWVPDFWTYRLHSHADYVLYTRSCGRSNEKSSLLAETFHASERILLDQRLPQIIGGVHCSDDSIKRMIAHCQDAEKKIRALATTGSYLVIGRHDLKSIQRLVQYDNRLEYLFSCNMFGMPDFFFRKEIVHFLVSAGVIEKRPSIVFYNQNELDNGLRQLEENYDGSWRHPERGTKFAPDISANHPDYLWRGLRDDGASSVSRNQPH